MAYALEDFFTREKSNEGTIVPLSLPDGTPTEHWVRLKGVDSDTFRKAEAEARRKVIDFSREVSDKNLPPDQEREARHDFAAEARLDLVASLISEWSFPVEATRENVLRFLREAPQEADRLDRLAYDRAEFFKKN